MRRSNFWRISAAFVQVPARSSDTRAVLTSSPAAPTTEDQYPSSRDEGARPSRGEARLDGEASPLSREQGDESRFARLAWRVYLGGIALLISGYALAHFLGPSWLKSGLVFNLIGGSSVVALILGARRNSGRSGLPWYLLAVGQALFVTSDVLAFNYERLFGTVMPFPRLRTASTWPSTRSWSWAWCS